MIDRAYLIELERMAADGYGGYEEKASEVRAILQWAHARRVAEHTAAVDFPDFQPL